MNDHEQIKQYQKRMTSACKNLHEMCPSVGKARQIIEFDSDRRKSALARHMVAFLKAGDAAVAAEAKARATEAYSAELDQLAKELEDAQVTKFKFEAEERSFDCAQSLLAMERELLKMMPE